MHRRDVIADAMQKKGWTLYPAFHAAWINDASGAEVIHVKSDIAEGRLAACAALQAAATLLLAPEPSATRDEDEPRGDK